MKTASGSLQPSLILNNSVQIQVRIYHEDTDAGGVVYHANYLRYLERARSEWLRAHGFDHDRIAREFGLLFVVRALTIKYLKPAKLGDILNILATPISLNRGLVKFAQEVTRGEEVLVRSEVQVISVALPQFNSTEVPPALVAALNLVPEAFAYCAVSSALPVTTPV